MEWDAAMERNDSDCDFDGSMSAEISLVEGGTESSNSSTSSSCSGMCCNSIISVYQQNKHFIGGFVETEKNFGVMKKGSYRPASDFAFKFVAEVICDSPQSSGFIVKLMPERNQHLLSAVSERYDLAASI